jgi:molybdenum cofactor cytidylyltransferase
MLEKLRRLAVNQNWPLLIEADGSRRRPLKAPAEHEPVVPAWVNNAVVVAGLSGINQPLNESWVHRPERFARISGLSVGDPVTPESLVRVLVDPAGGLWNLPEFAQKTVLLNQASSDKLSAAGKQMTEALLKVYERVIIADLSIPGQGTRRSTLPPGSKLPMDIADEYFRGEVSAVHEKIAGIILAAGGSQRMGRPKQLLDWKGKPFVRHVAQTALAAGLDPVILVVGAMASEVMKAVEDLPVQIVHNPAWETGQSSSLICGMKSLQVDTDGRSVRKIRKSASGTSVGGVVFLLADQPQIPETLVRALMESHAQTLSPIVVPQTGGRRGNPVLFDRCTFDDLVKLSGDVGGRALFSKYPVQWLPWLDESILTDIDTTQDYERFLHLE